MIELETFRLDGLVVHVSQGDIARYKADALVTAINSDGQWYGGIDGVIQRAAGSMFHAQAQAALPLRHAETVVAKGTGRHTGRFRDVVFVIDDLKGPLSEVIVAALVAADAAGYAKVTLPAIRTGVMLGAVEKDAKAAAQEMAKGLRAFAARNPKSLKHATVVVYQQKPFYDALAKSLKNAA